MITLIVNVFSTVSFLYCHIYPYIHGLPYVLPCIMLYLLTVFASLAPPRGVCVSLPYTLSLSSCRLLFRFHSFRLTSQFSQPLLILCSSPLILLVTLLLNLLQYDNILYCAGHRTPGEFSQVLNRRE